MNDVKIYSRDAMEKLIESGFPSNTAVISFYDPVTTKGRHKGDADYQPIDFYGVCDDVFYVEIPDIDIEILEDYGYTFNTYFDDAPELARFIKDVWDKGEDIICQCEYGQSRSAACAAAIKECFCSNGIDIFADYRYYPNQLVYNKVIVELRALCGK